MALPADDNQYTIRVGSWERSAMHVRVKGKYIEARQAEHKYIRGK